jgi:hypothetical protein
MTKVEALKIIYNCAELYKLNLEGKVLLIISIANDNSIRYSEIKFLKNNFLHLTGVDVKEGLNANVFYDRCLSHTLSVKDFELKNNGTTELKLQVLPQLMNISQNANMIGDFDNSKRRLYAEKVTGNVNACIGLKQTGNFCVPVSSLKEDIRDITINRERIIATFIKSLKDSKYGEIKYLAKGDVDLSSDKISEILEKVDIKKLVLDFNTTHSLANKLKEYINNIISKQVQEQSLQKTNAHLKQNDVGIESSK